MEEGVGDVQGEERESLLESPHKGLSDGVEAMSVVGEDEEEGIREELRVLLQEGGDVFVSEGYLQFPSGENVSA